jgi:hypothetical protein
VYLGWNRENQDLFLRRDDQYWMCHELNSNLPLNIDYHSGGLPAGCCRVAFCLRAFLQPASRLAISLVAGEGGPIALASASGRRRCPCFRSLHIRSHAGVLSRLLGCYAMEETIQTRSVASCLLLLDYLLGLTGNKTRAAGLLDIWARCIRYMYAASLERRGGR